jgi:hypothetical protein
MTILYLLYVCLVLGLATGFLCAITRRWDLFLGAFGGGASYAVLIGGFLSLLESLLGRLHVPMGWAVVIGLVSGGLYGWLLTVLAPDRWIRTLLQRCGRWWKLQRQRRGYLRYDFDTAELECLRENVVNMLAQEVVNRAQLAGEAPDKVLAQLIEENADLFADIAQAKKRLGTAN